MVLFFYSLPLSSSCFFFDPVFAIYTSLNSHFVTLVKREANKILSNVPVAIKNVEAMSSVN